MPSYCDAQEHTTKAEYEKCPICNPKPLPILPRSQLEQDRLTLTAMQRHGGSFVRSLAECGFRADDANLARIKAAFPELWANYRRIAERGTAF